MAARRAYIEDARGLPLLTPEALDAVPLDGLPALIMQLTALVLRAAARLAQTSRPDPAHLRARACPNISRRTRRGTLREAGRAEHVHDHARHQHVLRGGQRRRALLADLAAIARRLSADEWARQQQVETLEEGRGA
jgi:hypothetical protein